MSTAYKSKYSMSEVEDILETAVQYRNNPTRVEYNKTLTDIDNIETDITNIKTKIGKLNEEIPTKVSELENDSGYLTQAKAIERFVQKGQISTALAKKADKEDVDGKFNSLPIKSLEGQEVSPTEGTTVIAGTGATIIGDTQERQYNENSRITQGNVASGDYSTASGVATTASGAYSTAMGRITKAQGANSTAMGGETTASGTTSTAMGSKTIASGRVSTAMGIETTASGQTSTAMGDETIASGDYSTAMGNQTIASGFCSTAMGQNTTASGQNQTALGKFNIEDTEDKYDFIIGNGTSASNRSNALTVDWDGNGVFSGDVTDGSGNVLSEKADKSSIPRELTDLKFAVKIIYTTEENADEDTRELSAGVYKVYSKGGGGEIGTGEIIVVNPDEKNDGVDPALTLFHPTTEYYLVVLNKCIDYYGNLHYITIDKYVGDISMTVQVAREARTYQYKIKEENIYMRVLGCTYSIESDWQKINMTEAEFLSELDKASDEIDKKADKTELETKVDKSTLEQEIQNISLNNYYTRDETDTLIGAITGEGSKYTELTESLSDLKNTMQTTSEKVDGFDTRLDELENAQFLVLSNSDSTSTGTTTSEMAPEMHRVTFRGKNLGSSVTDEQRAAIKDGSFKDLYLGDYWVINDITWRIVDIDYWWNTGSPALTTHHLVIMPDTSLYNAMMNSEDIIDGGYMGSDMHTTNLTQAKTMITSAFSDMILSRKEYLTSKVEDGVITEAQWVTSSVEIPNEIMMYGTNIFSTANSGSHFIARFTLCRIQLALFAIAPKFITIGEYYWLRDIVSDVGYAGVNKEGVPYFSYPEAEGGVRPVFAIQG